MSGSLAERVNTARVVDGKTLTRRPSLSYCPFIRKRLVSELVAHTARDSSLTAFVVSFERRFRMGTKPMVFPLDADGRVYALHNENDEQLCTGSRETCYRLLELMLEVKRRTDECQPEATELIKTLEQTPKAASAASSS